MPCVRGKSGRLQHNGPPDSQRALSLVFTAASKEFPRNRRRGRRLATSPCGATDPRAQALPSSRDTTPERPDTGRVVGVLPTSTTHVRVLPTRGALLRGEAGARAGDLRQEQQDARAVQRAPALPPRVQGERPSIEPPS